MYSEMLPEGGLSSAQRRHIQRDIARWKLELEMANSFTTSELSHYISELQEMEDTTLVRWWADNVGEWVASRRDLDVPLDVDMEDWIEDQFEVLIDGEATGYGFVVDVELPQPT